MEATEDDEDELEDGGAVDDDIEDEGEEEEEEQQEEGEEDNEMEEEEEEEAEEDGADDCEAVAVAGSAKEGKGTFSCACCLVFFTNDEETPWSPRVNACLRCFIWWLSFPGKSYEDFLEDEAKASSGSSKAAKKRRKEKSDIDVSKPLALKPAEVVFDSAAGYHVKAPYKIWSPKEFVDDWHCNHKEFTSGKIKVTMANIINELGKEELVVIARVGTRILEVCNFEMCRKSESVMRRHVREAQPLETFQWATKQSQAEPGPIQIHAGKTKPVSVKQLGMAVKAHMKKIKAVEGQGDEDEQGEGDEEESSEGEDEAGLQLPRRRTVGAAAASAKPKAARKTLRKTGSGKASGSQTRPKSKLEALSVAVQSVPGSVQFSTSRPGFGEAEQPGKSVMSERGGGCGGAASVASVGIGASPAGKRQDCYFDWDAVLKGKETGTLRAGAVRHLGTLTGKTKSHNQLSNEIACFDQVKLLRDKGLDDLPLAKMQHAMKQAQRLCQVKFEAKMFTKLAIKYGGDLLRKEEWVEFSVSCRPWFRKDDLKFSVDVPHLSSYIHESFSPAVEQELAEALGDFFFSDDFCALFAEPIDKNCMGYPVFVAVEIMKQYEASEDSDLDNVSTGLCESMDLVLAACKGIIAVSLAIPGAYGSCYVDAQKVFAPENLSKEDALSEEAARRLGDVKLAAMKNPHWRARIQAYWTLGLPDASIAPDHDSLLELLRSQLLLDPPFDVALAEKALQKCGAWNKELRSGGCAWVYEALVKGVKHFIKDQAVTVVSNDVAATVLKVIALVDPLRSDEVLVKLSRGVKEQVAKCARDETQVSLTNIVSQAANAARVDDASLGLTAALDGCKNLDLEEGLVRQLVDFRGHLVGHVTQTLIESTTKGSRWAPLIEATSTAIASINDLAGVKKMNEHVDKTWDDLHPLAKAGMDFKTHEAALGVADGGETHEFSTLVASVLTSKEVLTTRLAGFTIVDSTSSHIRNVHAHLSTALANSTETLTRRHHAAKQQFFKELAKAKSRLDKVAGGTDDASSWKADVAVDAKIADMTDALKKLEMAYIQAAQTRIDAVKQVFAQLKKLGGPDEAVGSGAARNSNLIDFAQESVMKASATIYECKIWSASKLGGTQRKKQLGSASNQWQRNTKDIQGHDLTPSAWIHAALDQIAKKG